MKGGGSGRKRYTKYTSPINEGGSLYGSGSSKTDDCATINFISQLEKVQPALSTVVAGEILTIGFTRNTLPVYNDAGDICGYLAAVQIAQLIACIKKGYKYKAAVLSISGSVCKVHVKSDL
jgi:hypothetical protein